jgi:septal ring factor EnvC (AmiA/AmiB activator)
VNRPFIACVCLLVLTASAAGPAAASREQELADIRAEIAHLRERLQEVERRRTGLASDMERTDLELELQEKRVAEARAARELASEELVLAEEKVVELEERLEATRQVLEQRLAGLYRLGRQGYLRLFLALEEGENVFSGIRTLRYLVRRDSEAIDHYVAVHFQLAREREKLVAKQQEVESWLGREDRRRRELVALRRRQSVLLARFVEEQAELTSQTEALLDKERKLESLLEFLYGRATTPLSGEPIQEFRGVLDWPNRGQVTVGFGPRLDPRYKTRVPHNGIDLATEPGSQVRVVYPGRVVFAARFQGYGLTAVVHHPGRVFSLYAGLATLQAGNEDVLSLGGLIGVASERLYFEIRAENRPEDPLAWLR